MSVDPAAGRALARALRARLASRLPPTHPGRPVIGISGESGSGKSVTALALAEALDAAGVRTAVLHQDDYFLRPPRTNHEHRLRDLSSVGPHEVDLARLAAHVASFRAGDHDVEAPVVDYPRNRFLARRLDLGAADALIVEGTYVLRGLPDLDGRVFLAATHEDTRERRRIRARDADEPIIDTILDIEHRLIAPQAELADVVIDRDFRIV